MRNDAILETLSMSTHEVSWSPSVYPRYESYNKRLATFFERFWPVSLTQDNYKMADAGFFYSGFGDIVICAFCGLCLNKWQPNDDPIIEHRKFNKDCKFVRLFLDKNSNNNRINLNSIKLLISSSLFYLRKNFYYYGNIIYFYLHEKVLKRRIHNNFINICKICLIEESNILLLPCRHVSTCLTCTLCTEICPICRCEIISTIKIFFA